MKPVLWTPSCEVLIRVRHKCVFSTGDRHLPGGHCDQDVPELRLLPGKRRRSVPLQPHHPVSGPLGPAAAARHPDLLGPRPRDVALSVAGSRGHRRQVRSVRYLPGT